MLLQPKYIPSKAPWFLPDILTPFARILASTSKYPVQTIIAIAILASTTYIALLEASLFDQNPELSVGYWGFGRSTAWTKDALVGSVTLKLMDRGLWHQVDGDVCFSSYPYLFIGTQLYIPFGAFAITRVLASTNRMGATGYRPANASHTDMSLPHKSW